MFQKQEFCVLLVKRDNYQFKNKWFLLGGFVNIDEDLEDSAKRILANKVEKIDKMKTGGGHRPATLFKYEGSEENDKLY